MRERWLVLCLVVGVAVFALLPWLRADASVGPQAPVSSPQPRVVINEIAWGGTAAGSADEWIELRNTTGVTIALAGWHLTADDGSPDIALVGEIAPYGYFLIERTDDTAVSDIPADLTCPFGTGLSNAGETLRLSDATDGIVDTANADGGEWPTDGEGGSPDYLSMERVSPFAPDVAGNWISNDGTHSNGLDANGIPIRGTPRARNAAFWPAWLSGADLAVEKVGPAYAVPGDLVTHTLAVANRGGLTVTARLTDELAAELTFLAQESDAGAAFTQDGRTLLWTVADLASGARTSITLTTRLAAQAPTGGVVTNTLLATSPTTEINPADNTAAWAIDLVPPSADLAITKVGSQTLATGSEITYTLRVTNSGDYAATDVVVRDVLPAELAFVRQVGSLTFNGDPPTLTWGTVSLAPGAGHTVTLVAAVTVPVTSTDLVTNTAIVTSTTAELDPADNVSTASTRIGAPRLLISGVLYDGYQLDDEDEAIELVNTGTAQAGLVGWSVCEDNGGELACRALPDLAIEPASYAWVAKDAAAFATSFGFSPTAVLASWPRLANTGDEVVLKDPEGSLADAVVYGDGSLAAPGWSGPALAAYTGTGRGEEGQILSRRRDEGTGLPVADTDTAGDWIQVPDDPLVGRQVRYPGWDGYPGREAPLFAPVTTTETAAITVGIAPDNAFEVVSQTLMRATRSISIETYRLTHPLIASLLAEKAAGGVSVTVLLEGNPVGLGDDTPEWLLEMHACETLEAAGGRCVFMVHEPDDRVYNRYHYLHAKTILVDDTWVIIGTQNLTPGSLPADDKANGTLGSRGVVLVTDSPTAVAWASRLFALDLDPAHHNDIVRWNTSFTARYRPPPPDLVMPDPTDGISYTVRFTAPLEVSGGMGLELFTAPDAALRRSDAMLGLVARTGDGDEVLVEQQYERVIWADGPAGANPRLVAYIDAARRGARVRLLLNGLSYVEGFEGPDADNAATVAYVNALAVSETLDLRAAFGNPTYAGIHNKMVLVALDGTRYSHIGSINGSEAASKVNREVAIQVRSDPLHAALRSLFELDWALSNKIYLPLVLRAFTPPTPPATYPVVSEVAYSVAAAEEWVEVHNPTGDVIDLSTWKLGDAETRDVYEPMFAFPPGTLLGPGGTLVVAVNASEVPEATLEFYDSDPAVPNMIPYPSWGSTAYPFALRGAGDQVLLLDGADGAVDVVVWGDRSYPGVTPHPGVLVLGASLERFPSGADTDDCASDFRERYPPTPGLEP